MVFNGVPVLFIPGNSGSHRQVRSLASVSLMKAVSSRSKFHFDYFSVDFNEEYSALFGGVLMEQTEFVHNSIKKILSLYEKNPSKPSSVVLVGHSMGGVVARGLFMLPDFKASLVTVIATLATPHAAPVLSVDWHLKQYYDAVNTFWAAHRGDSLENVTFISLGGGHRDIMVQSSLTSISTADINKLTTDIPTVWLSTDHLCSLWCKQLVLVLVRALFDIVNISTKQVSESPAFRKDVFHYHLVHRTGGKRFSIAEHPHQHLFSTNADWEEYLQRKFTISQPHGLRGTRHIMVRLISDEKHHWLTAVANNLEVKDWVFVCSANVVSETSRMCDVGINLSNETVFLPSTSVKRKMIHLDLLKLKTNTSFTHVVFRILPTSKPVELFLDVHSSARHFAVTLPHIIPFSHSVNILPNLTEEKALHYRLYLQDLEKLWQTYLLYVKPITCRRRSHQAVVKLHVPWNQEAVHKLVTGELGHPLKVKLQSSRPATYNGAEHAWVDVILDASCQYSLSLQSSVVDSLGQLVRFYSPQLLAYIVAILLLVLCQQMLELSKTGSCVMFHTALATGAKPYYFLLIVSITSQALRWSISIMPVSFLATADPLLVQTTGTDSLILSLMLYMVSFIAVFLLGILCWATIILSGQAAHKMALRFIAKTVTGVIVLSDWTLSALSHLPATVAIILLALAFSTCGSLSLCLGLFFFFLVLCKMYEDYLEHLVRISLHFIAKTLKGGTKNKQRTSNKTNMETDNLEESQEDRKNEENESSVRRNKKEQETIAGEETKEEKAKKEPYSLSEQSKLAKQPKEAQTSSGNKQSKDGETTLSALHFKFTIFLIWLAVCALNVPSVLVWAHNYRYNRKLEPDPSLPVSVILCICAGFLWQIDVPKRDLKYYTAVSKILYGFAIGALCFGPQSLYILSPVLTAAIAVVTIHQMFFPSSTTV